MKRIPKFLRNRYAALAGAFIIYISFIDTHDLITQIGHRHKLRQIHQEMEYLQDQIDLAGKQSEELSSDKVMLEKYAREQYRMKRENEEIFVIIK